MALEKPNFKVNKIEPGVFHLSFSSLQEMTATFLRFQEHYESPQFQGKVFSLKEYKKWYRTTTASGKFTYYTDWGGFNIPSSILEPFYGGKFKRLSQREKDFLEVFKGIKGKFYIIGSLDGSVSTMAHEVSHSRFYLNEKYQKEIVASLSKYDIKPLRKWLIKTGYSETVIADEVQAYLLNDWGPPTKELAAYDYTPLIKELRIIQNKYYGK